MITAYKKSHFRLLLTMVLVSLLVITVAVTVIYHFTLNSKKEYLKQLCDHESTLLLSVYTETGDRDVVLSKIHEQQFLHPGLGASGEFLVSMLEGDSIRLLYYKGIREEGGPRSLPINGLRGEAIKFAASGNTGFLKGTDYLGNRVLAYGTFIPELNWGIVTEVGYNEIIKPFWEASLYAVIASLVLVLAGIYVFKRFSDPLFERIRESEEKYHMLFELIPSGVTIANIRGEIVESNKESERLLGIARDLHSGMRIDSDEWKIIRLDRSPMPVSEYASTTALRENRVVTNVEMGIERGEGVVTWLNVSAAPFPLSDLGIIVVYTDITRRIEAEMMLKEHDQQMEKLVQELKILNDTKDKFFSIIAHDLKNPFGSLLGASEYLYKEIENHDTRKARKLSKILYDSSKNAYDILANLLDWSRSQSGSLEFEPRLINLYDVVIRNVQLLGLQAEEKNIGVLVEMDEEFRCTADPNMLNTVLRNLLINALKFTKPGGEVAIRASRKNREVLVSVQDNGIGMPQEDLDKLFRIDVKYVNTGTNNEKGTGLGLILCREFIQQHGGKIWVESRLNEGSTFYFTIPDAEKRKS